MAVDLDMALDDMTKTRKKGGGKKGGKGGDKKEVKKDGEKKPKGQGKKAAPLPKDAMEMGLDDIVKGEKDARVTAAKERRAADQKTRQADQKRKQEAAQKLQAAQRKRREVQKGNNWTKGGYKGGKDVWSGKGSYSKGKGKSSYSYSGNENRSQNSQRYEPYGSSKGSGKGSSKGGNSSRSGSGRDGPIPGRSISIRNCPVGVKGQDLKDAFGGVGTVTWVSEVDARKKEAFLTFREAKSAHEAEFQFDGGEINGKKIQISVVKGENQ